MRKAMTLVPIVLLVGGLVAGCGSDDNSSGGSNDDYCDTAKSIKDDVSNVDFETLDEKTFDQLQDNIHSLQESAPSEVEESWGVLAGKIDELDKILSDAGLSLDDLAGLQSGQLPEGVDMAKLQEMSTKLQAFSDTSDLDPALKKIQKSLKDDCGIDTEDSGS